MMSNNLLVTISTEKVLPSILLICLMNVSSRRRGYATCCRGKPISHLLKRQYGLVVTLTVILVMVQNRGIFRRNTRSRKTRNCVHVPPGQVFTLGQNTQTGPVLPQSAFSPILNR